MIHRNNDPDTLRIGLAHALGFPKYPIDNTAAPYLNYLTNRHIGRGTLDGYIRLLINIIGHFEDGYTNNQDSPPKRSIQGLLDTLSASTDLEYFTDTEADGGTRREDVEDTVLYAIGTWTMLLSSFVHLPFAGGFRKVTLAYRLRTQGKRSGCQSYQEDVAGLVIGSGLLPAPSQHTRFNDIAADDGNIRAALRLSTLLKPLHGSQADLSLSSGVSNCSVVDEDLQSRLVRGFLHDLDSLESFSINSRRLNAYTLKVFGAVELVWTYNVSRHLLLSKRNGRHILEVFALPCALTALASETVGICPELAQEIGDSYALLFNASETPQHAKLGRVFGAQKFCWCWSCSAQRYRNQAIAGYKKFSQFRTSTANRSQQAQGSEYDPLLVELISNEPSDWTPDLFPSLWSRIMILEEHLQLAKPWSIWVLFRDRRDTLQFWTFLFATIIVFLTVLQVLLSIAQVAGSFV